MTLPIRALREFCSIIQGGRHGLSGNDFVPVGYPAYGAGGMNGCLDTYEFDETAIVLSSIGARCGKCFFVEGRWSSLANTQVIFPDKAQADPRFLWFQLNDERRWHRSGTGQPFIKPSDVKEHKVYLPSLADQRRIAAILDQADALRAKRRESLAQLETLKQSIFLDMFGEPKRNPMKWPIKTLGEITTETKLGLVRSSEEFGPNFEIPYVRMNAIGRSGEFFSDLVLRTSVSSNELDEFALEYGDLLFNTRNSKELVGKTALFRQSGKYVFNNNVMRIRFHKNIKPEYVAAAFMTQHIQHELEIRKSGTTSVFAIYARELKSLPINVPPINLQQEFSDRATQIEESGNQQRKALDCYDLLFASLQHRAFRGEL